MHSDTQKPGGSSTAEGFGPKVVGAAAWLTDKALRFPPFAAAWQVQEHAVDMTRTILGAMDAPVGTTPKETVWRKNKAQLYRYTRTAPATRKTPILCIMPLINRAYILDLRPGQSFIEYLVAQGHDVFLLDWGEAGDEDRDINLDRLVTQYIARAIRQVAKLCRGPLTLLGYCIGGALATCTTALHTEGLIKNLILMTTPIDFTDSGMFGVWTAEGVFPIDLLTETYPAVPGTFPDVGSKMLSPLSSAMGQYAKLDEKMRSASFDVKGWQAMYRWVNDGVPFPAAAYHQWITEFYQSNKLLKGKLEMDGRKVLLSNIRCPVLNIVASSDIIAPRPTTSAVLKHVGSTDKQELIVKGGHVGIVVGRSAQTDLWPKVSSWLQAHDAPSSGAA
jgi:polyhydroxyalkanoate synthase